MLSRYPHLGNPAYSSAAMSVCWDQGRKVAAYLSGQRPRTVSADPAAVQGLLPAVLWGWMPRLDPSGARRRPGVSAREGWACPRGERRLMVITRMV